jgi:hypothetical protein
MPQPCPDYCGDNHVNEQFVEPLLGYLFTPEHTFDNIISKQKSDGKKEAVIPYRQRPERKYLRVGIPCNIVKYEHTG